MMMQGFDLLSTRGPNPAGRKYVHGNRSHFYYNADSQKNVMRLVTRVYYSLLENSSVKNI